MAQENARANGLMQQVHFEQADGFRLPKHLRNCVDHVFSNPPFHQSVGEISPDADRARALTDHHGLARWIAAALARVSAGGTLTIIVRADRIGETLSALPEQGVTVFPLWPRRHEPAKRAIVQACKNSRARLALLSGLVLHDDDGRYTKQAEAVLRGGELLALTSPRR